MSLLWRSWLTFTAVILVVLFSLSVLSLLQHSALLSGLIRQRMAVVAEAVGDAFQPIVDLGLPLSMMRNCDEIVERLRQTDPTITAIHIFNPTGIVVYSTDLESADPVPVAALEAQRLAGDGAWSVESPEALLSGNTIRRSDGTEVGGVLVAYSRDDLMHAIDTMNRRIGLVAVALGVVFSALAYGVLRVALAAPMQGMKHFAALARSDPLVQAGRGPVTARRHPGQDLLRAEIAELAARLGEANRAYEALTAELDALGAPETGPAGDAAPAPGRNVIVLQSPQTSLARRMARRLLPWAAALILLASAILGTLTLRAVNRSVEPEIAARIALIGDLVSGNVQRAVSAGVPIDELVGLDRYVGNLLRHFPEIAHVAIATGRIVFAAGDRVGTYLGPSGAPGDTPGYPIRLDGEEVGYVLVDADPDFVAQRFRDVFLDLLVIVLVTILVAFEVLALMLSRSLTGPLDRLHHLLALQATGDFSKHVSRRARNAFDAVSEVLSGRVLRLNQRYAQLAFALAGDRNSIATLRALGERHGLASGGPARLIFPYFTDIRLALFLFAAADELPLSFMPIYIRAAGNPWPWLDENVLMSLPLAGYLLAILIASPFARELAGRYGHRRVLAIAALPTLAGQVGLAFAGNAAEIIAFRSLTGFGYAIVTLACQDYVLDVTAPRERSRALALFTLVLFGGVFSGTALGGVLADRLGFGAVFLISACLIAASAVLFLRLLPAREAAPQVERGARLMPPLLAPMRSLRFAGLVFGIAIPANVLLQAFLSYLVALVLDSFGASPGDIGRTLMSYFVVVALISPPVAQVADNRLPPALLALAGAVLSGAALLPGAIWPSTWTMLVGVVLGGLGHTMVRGPQVSVAMGIAESDLARLGSNAVLAALRTLERGGSILGLVGIAALAGAFGYRIAILAIAVWVIGGAVFFLGTELAGARARSRGLPPEGGQANLALANGEGLHARNA